MRPLTSKNKTRDKVHPPVQKYLTYSTVRPGLRVEECSCAHLLVKGEKILVKDKGGARNAEEPYPLCRYDVGQHQVFELSGPERGRHRAVCSVGVRSTGMGRREGSSAFRSAAAAYIDLEAVCYMIYQNRDGIVFEAGVLCLLWSAVVMAITKSARYEIRASDRGGGGPVEIDRAGPSGSLGHASDRYRLSMISARSCSCQTQTDAFKSQGTRIVEVDCEMLYGLPAPSPICEVEASKGVSGRWNTTDMTASLTYISCFAPTFARRRVGSKAAFSFLASNKNRGLALVTGR